MFRKSFEVPEGMTLEQLIEAAEAYQRKKRREYLARRPEMVMQQRITSAANLLKKHGFIVLEADGFPGDPWSWDFKTEDINLRAALDVLRSAIETARKAATP